MNIGLHSRVVILDSRESFASCSYRQSRILLEIGIFKSKFACSFLFINPVFLVDFPYECCVACLNTLGDYTLCFFESP